MAIRVQLLGCLDCYVSGNSDRIVLINCSGMNTAPASGRTYIQNGRVLPNLWVELNSVTADASLPYTLTGNNGNKYKVKADTGDRYAILDTVALNGTEVNFKFTNATYSLILSTSTNTETIDGNALPFTISGLLYDNYVVSSDGSNFHLL